jgi:hypothetical protein
LEFFDELGADVELVVELLDLSQTLLVGVLVLGQVTEQGRKLTEVGDEESHAEDHDKDDPHELEFLGLLYISVANCGCGDNRPVETCNVLGINISVINSNSLEPIATLLIIDIEIGTTLEQAGEEVHAKHQLEQGDEDVLDLYSDPGELLNHFPKVWYDGPTSDHFTNEHHGQEARQ